MLTSRPSSRIGGSDPEKIEDTVFSQIEKRFQGDNNESGEADPLRKELLVLSFYWRACVSNNWLFHSIRSPIPI
jgi:hypothetical protein